MPPTLNRTFTKLLTYSIAMVAVPFAAYKLAGDNAMYLEYKNRVWWWGRGLRWPGWYIIGYLSARSLYFDAKEDSDAEFTTGEAGILVPIWLGLLFLLVQYGLPDY